MAQQFNSLPPNFPKKYIFNCQNTTVCPDQFAFVLEDGKLKEYSAAKPKCRIYSNIDYSQNHADKKIIAIILESPHKQEYKGPNSPAPALGRTGYYFESYFSEILQKSSVWFYVNTGIFHIALINAVQYQCSLGQELKTTKAKKIRDDNFISCMNNGSGKDLSNRLTNLSPIVVINLCTRGMRNLNSIVESYIKNDCIKDHIPYASGNHPASWRWTRNRFIT